MDEEMAGRLHELVQQHPTFGYRRLWALLRFGQHLSVNLKKVHRIVQIAALAGQRALGCTPATGATQSQPDRAQQRALGHGRHTRVLRQDGWGHLAAVIDCHDRQIIGFEFALRGRAKEAERALEQACLARFGTLRPTGDTPTIRSATTAEHGPAHRFGGVRKGVRARLSHTDRAPVR
jgi:putative transposase